MATDTKYTYLILWIIGITIVVAVVVVQFRNSLVQRLYKGTSQNIKQELNCYQELNNINYQIWDSNNDINRTIEFKKSIEKLNPDAEELKESKQYLLNALNYIYIAQKESGLSVSDLNLAENQPKLNTAKEYLDKATEEADKSTEALQKYEDTHQDLF